MIEEGAVDDHMFVLVEGAVRVHQGDATLATLDAGATVGELAALVPGAALGVRHRARAVDAAAHREGRARRAAARPSRAGERRHRALVAMVRARRRTGTETPSPAPESTGRARRVARRGRAVADRAVRSVRRHGRAAGRRRQRHVPRGVRPGWLPGDVHRHRARRRRRVGGDRAQARSASTCCGIAVVVLGGAAVLFGTAWAIAAGGDGAWVSAPLLVLFPILIQLGFVFIGGQAGRILDIARDQGGLPADHGRLPGRARSSAACSAAPLVTCGSDRGPAARDGGRAGRLRRAGLGDGPALRRHALGRPGGTPPTAGGDGEPDDAARRGLAPRLFGSRFVALILGYQVLSALGSQLADFLVFDRATAQFPAAEDLARFLGRLHRR